MQTGVSAVSKKRFFSLLVACVLLGLPASAAAAPFKVGFSITRPDEGVVCSELTYNDEIIWKIQLLSDGARPVSGGGSGQTTIIVPDIAHGLFAIKINRQ